MGRAWACKVRDSAFLAGLLKLRQRAEVWPSAGQKLNVQSLAIFFFKTTCEGKGNVNSTAKKVESL